MTPDDRDTDDCDTDDCDTDDCDTDDRLGAPPDGPTIGFGVIGARSFVATRAVLPAIDASRRGRLVATASLSGPVPEPWRRCDVGSYEAVLGHPDVDAVYVPLPNAMHHEWVLRAAAAGKHVLCEKPLATDAASASAMVEACRDAGVVLAEAWMTPFDPRWAATVDLARHGAVGEITSVDSTFTFTIPAHEHANHRWDPAQGGGALLDVGIYCLGVVAELWDTEPTTVSAVRTAAVSGVDATTRFELGWSDGRRATGRCSFVEPELQRLVLTGTGGKIVLDGGAFTGGRQAESITIERLDESPYEIHVEADDPYRRMIEAFADAAAGTSPWARPPERAVALVSLLDRIAERSQR